MVMQAALRSMPESDAPGESQAALPAPSSTDWDAIARAHNRRVVVHLLARGLALDDAEEVAQRTWTRLLALDRARRLPYVEMPGLALAQARFLAASLRRERSGQLARDGGDDDALALVVDDRADQERTVVDRDRVQRALAELANVPASALQVFRRVLEDPPPTHAEIAKDVGLSEQRVKQIVCETRARLRRAIDAKEVLR